MLTPHLEKLILSGKASYKTFVAGGAEKSVLNVYNDRYIIITDITYFSACPFYFNAPVSVQEDEFKKNILTQLKVKSEKSNNVFVFRNSLMPAFQGGTRLWFTPNGSTKLDTYLVHESNVVFTFSMGANIIDSLSGPTPAIGTGFAVPSDYGKSGLGPEITIRQKGKVDIIDSWITVPAGNELLSPGENVQQLEYPVNTELQYNNIESTNAFPLAIVQYVEILGNPTNIGATL